MACEEFLDRSKNEPIHIEIPNINSGKPDNQPTVEPTPCTLKVEFIVGTAVSPNLIKQEFKVELMLNVILGGTTIINPEIIQDPTDNKRSLFTNIVIPSTQSSMVTNVHSFNSPPQMSFLPRPYPYAYKSYATSKCKINVLVYIPLMYSVFL